MLIWLYIDCSHNKLSSLPPELFSCPTLVYLHLEHNCLTELPEEIGQLSHIDNLVSNQDLCWTVQPFKTACLRYLHHKVAAVSTSKSRVIKRWKNYEVMLDLLDKFSNLSDMCWEFECTSHSCYRIYLTTSWKRCLEASVSLQSWLLWMYLTTVSLLFRLLCNIWKVILGFNVCVMCIHMYM